MTVLIVAAIIAAWALAAFLVLVIFARVVSRADEENEVSSMRREVSAAGRVAYEVPSRVRWVPVETGSLSTPLHS